MYEIIIGKAERNLVHVVSGAADNHRTYRAAGAFWTGTESYEGRHACSDLCRDKLMEAFPIRSTVIQSSGEHVVGLPVEALSGNCETTEDATVYEFTGDTEADMLPIVCANCEAIMQDHLNPTFEYASKIHAPNDGADIWPPLCGSASASRNPLDDQPIAPTVAAFEALTQPNDERGENQCWECYSILG